MVSRPWLLYVYPWMPYPRRIIIYLREKGIPLSLVKVIRVSDPGQGNQVVTSENGSSIPPRPAGSLPILAVPKKDVIDLIAISAKKKGKEDQDQKNEEFIYIRQSIAIMNFLDDISLRGLYGFPSRSDFPTSKNNDGDDDDDDDVLGRAREHELLAIADELTGLWNPVRIFGTGAGPMRIPAAAKEMLRWVRRTLLTAEGLVAERYREDRRPYFNYSGQEGEGQRQVTIADIVLYQYFEFMEDCYGVDMTDLSSSPVFASNKDITTTSGNEQQQKKEENTTTMTTTDVYGRSVMYQFPNLKRFYQEFRQRPSARRDAEAGEVPDPATYTRMTDWSEGVLKEG
jgi:glutathione S-transferase